MWGRRQIGISTTELFCCRLVIRYYHRVMKRFKTSTLYFNFSLNYHIPISLSTVDISATVGLFLLQQSPQSCLLSNVDSNQHRAFFVYCRQQYYTELANLLSTVDNKQLTFELFCWLLQIAISTGLHLLTYPLENSSVLTHL